MQIRVSDGLHGFHPRFSLRAVVLGVVALANIATLSQALAAENSTISLSGRSASASKAQQLTAYLSMSLLLAAA